MAAEDNTRSPLERALGDGEDFELLLAVPPIAATALIAAQPLATELTKIGTFIETPGLWQGTDELRRLPVTGFEHQA